MQKIDRMRRIGEQIRRDLALVVSNIIDHPHVSMLSFTDVRVTRDLSFAKVYVTHVLNNPAEREMLVSALNENSGRFRHYLAQKLSLRKVPELIFYYDASIEHGARMEHMLEELVKQLPDNTDN